MNLHSVLPRSRANGPGVRTVLWLQGCSLRCPGCFNPDTHSPAPRLTYSVDELLALLGGATALPSAAGPVVRPTLLPGVLEASEPDRSVGRTTEPDESVGHTTEPDKSVGRTTAATGPAANYGCTARVEGAHLEGLTVSGGEPLDQAAELVELLRRVRAETSLSVLLFTGYEWEEVQADAVRREVLQYLDVLLAGRYEAGQRLAAGLRGSANKTVHFLTDRYGPADLEDTAPAEIVIGPDGQVTVSGIDPPRVP